MARPSKGDRTAHMLKSHPAVNERLVERASAAGASSVSQYAADVLALYVGLPEHVRELNRPSLIPSKIDPLRGDVRTRIMVRPHRQVSERLVSQAPDHKIAPHIADILAAHVGLLEHVRTFNRSDEEGLPLAM